MTPAQEFRSILIAILAMVSMIGVGIAAYFDSWPAMYLGLFTMAIALVLSWLNL